MTNSQIREQLLLVCSGAVLWSDLRKARRYGAHFCLLFGLLMTGTLVAAQNSESFRDWTIADSIAVSYFSSPIGEGTAWMNSKASANIAVPSPDGKQIFFVRHRGVLDRDSNRYELMVFSMDEIRTALRETCRGGLKPTATLVRDSTSSHLAAIRNPRWQSDNGSIVFEGPDPDDGTPQVFRWELGTKKVSQLTHFGDARSVERLVSRDGTLLYNSYVGDDLDFAMAYPMVAASRTSEGYAWLPEGHVNVRQSGHAIFGGETAFDLQHPLIDGWIAPGGRRAIGLARLGKLRDYKWVNERRQFVLIDLEHRREDVLFSAAMPQKETFTNGLTPKALWFPPSQHVVLVNALVPASTPESVTDGPAAVVDYDLARKRWSVIEPLSSSVNGRESMHYIAAVEADGKDLAVRYKVQGGGTFHVTYRLRRDRWIRLPWAGSLPGVKASATSGVRIFVRQSANDPPVVMASNGRHEIALTDADPALDGVWRARFEPFSWRDADGKSVIGALLRPRRTAPGARLPLIVQSQAEVDPLVFLPDGSHSTGYAAQAFAARGFLVLLHPRSDELNSAAEGPAFVARLTAALDALDSAGLIDRSRVGAVGFSRLGFALHYAITHPAGTPLAAVAILDSTTLSYSAALADGVRTDLTDAHIPYVPGAIETFWRNKNVWFEQEVTFNVDRVRTPALFTIHGTSPGREPYEASSLPVLGAYRSNAKPIDYLWLPRAAHSTFRPRERLAEMSSVADWMSFWLQDKLPEDPERAARWAKLRDLQDAVLKHPPIPAVKWTATLRTPE